MGFANTVSEAKSAATVEAKLDRLLEVQEEHGEDLTALRRTLRGYNGDPGLVGRVAVMRSRQNGVIGVLTAAGMAVIGWIGWLIKNLLYIDG